MLHEAHSPPKFYTSSFKRECDTYLSTRFGMSQSDIKHYNLKRVFIRLVTIFHVSDIERFYFCEITKLVHNKFIINSVTAYIIQGGSWRVYTQLL